MFPDPTDKQLLYSHVIMFSNLQKCWNMALKELATYIIKSYIDVVHSPTKLLIPRSSDDIDYHAQFADCSEIGKCTGSQLLWVILWNFEMLLPKGQPIYYDKLMLRCEEKNL